MQKLFMIVLSAILFSSCTMPETKIYSLSLPDENIKSTVRTDALLNVTVHSPRYLSQSYMARRTSPYQIEISRYSKWDTSPVDLVRDAFKDALASSGMFKEIKTSTFPAEGFYSLEVKLKKFEKSDVGDVSFGQLVFEVNFRSPEGRELYSRVFSRTITLDDKGFLGLAKGLSSALAEGITETEAGMLRSMDTGGMKTVP